MNLKISEVKFFAKSKGQIGNVLKKKALDIYYSDICNLFFVAERIKQILNSILLGGGCKYFTYCNYLIFLIQ